MGTICGSGSLAAFQNCRVGRGRLRHTHISSGPGFQLCDLSRRHILAIAGGLVIFTFLLVVFAYHGGAGRGSWFSSVLVVLFGMIFVLFGPIMLCRFILHAYTRHSDQTGRNPGSALSDVSSFSDGGIANSRGPHVYACIIISPEDTVFPGCREPPNYDEALHSSLPVPKNPVTRLNEQPDSHTSESPPPSYREALTRMTSHSNSVRLSNYVSRSNDHDSSTEDSAKISSSAVISRSQDSVSPTQKKTSLRVKMEADEREKLDSKAGSPSTDNPPSPSGLETDYQIETESISVPEGSPSSSASYESIELPYTSV